MDYFQHAVMVYYRLIMCSVLLSLAASVLLVPVRTQAARPLSGHLSCKFSVNTHTHTHSPAIGNNKNDNEFNTFSVFFQKKGKSCLNQAFVFLSYTYMYRDGRRLKTPTSLCL